MSGVVYRVRGYDRTCGHDHATVREAMLCLHDLSLNRCAACGSVACSGEACGSRRVMGTTLWYGARIIANDGGNAQWRSITSTEYESIFEE